MDTNLFKVSEVCWAVTSIKTTEAQVFASIDDAAMYLESLGVPDDEVDAALIDMAAKRTTRANFGAVNHQFIYSDTLRFNELLGVA